MYYQALFLNMMFWSIELKKNNQFAEFYDVKIYFGMIFKILVSK